MYQTVFSFDGTSKRVKISDYSSGKDYTAFATDAKVGEWFNIRIEYYEAGDGANVKVYVAGELVMVSRKYYHTSHGSAIDADRAGFVRVSTQSSFEGDIYFDDVSYSRIQKEYVEQTPADNSIKIPEVHTFDDFVEQLGASYIYAADKSSTGNLTVVDGSDGNKYLSYKKTGQGENSSITFSTTLKTEDANVFVFESDMCLSHIAGGSNDLYLSVHSTSGAVYYTYFTVSSNSNLYFRDFYKDAAGKSVLGKNIALSVKDGEWFKFRLEFHEGTRNSLSFKAFVNDTKVMESKSYHTLSGDIADADSISSVLINGGMNFTGEALLDNTSLKTLVIEREESTIPEPDNTEIPEDAITFDDYKIPDSISGASGSTVLHTVVEAGDGNMALRIEKATATWAESGLFVKISESEEGADTFLFECDIFVTSFNQVAIYITDPVTKTSGNRNYLKYVSDSTAALGFNGVSAPIGEWVHFKLEYTKVDGNGRSTITIGDSVTVIEKSDTVDFENGTMIMFALQTATIHDVIYDNIVCKKVCSAAE